VVTGGVAFVCGVRREGPACGEEVCSREVDPCVPEEGCVRFVVGLSPFASPTLLRVDPKKDFAFEMLITACAKYDVLEERVSLCFGIRESAIGEIAPFETLMTSFWRLCRTAEGIPAKTIHTGNTKI
jgi:hypothetical protein